MTATEDQGTCVTCGPSRSMKAAESGAHEGHNETLHILLTGALLAIGLLLRWRELGPELAGHPLGEGLLLAAVVVGGYHIAREALEDLAEKVVHIELLIVIAAVGAIFIDALGEAAAVVFLFALAEFLEEYASDRNRRALEKLMELAPKEARVHREGELVKVKVEEVALKEVVIVRPGEQVPLDGVVVRGASTVNQAAVTGESLPQAKEPGDEVFGGTLNGEGLLEVEITHLAGQSALDRILELVEQAQAQRAPTEQLVDRFARYYTPAVVVGAVLLATLPTLLFKADFDTWFYRALVLLVISCPCALAISTPVSMVSAITAGARQGVLVKGGAHMESLAGVDTVAFDKTGTLTSGKLTVQAVEPVNGHNTEDVLGLALALEGNSEHPLALAIAAYAREQGAEAPTVEDFRSVTGKGVVATLDGRPVAVGSPRLFEPEALEDLNGQREALEDQGMTAVLVGQPEVVWGLIGVADTFRPEAPAIIAALHQTGYKTVMLTGDNPRTSAAVGARVGVEEQAAGLLPEEKVAHLKALQAQGRKILMVGDGVNDAPALAVAQVGVAMGAAGSDAALETADAALLEDSLARLPYLLRLSRKTMSVVRSNIALAITVKLAFAVLAAPGLVTLWLAVAVGDMGLSLLVIVNALRLGRGEG